MGLFDGTALERPVTCEACGSPLDACACPRDAEGQRVDPAGLAVRVHREKRRGKWVTVVSGIDGSAFDRAALLKAAKAAAAAGGGVRDDGYELQGDHRDAEVKRLKAAGFTATRAAGG